MTLELASRGYDMTGIDLSPEMLDIARERAAESNYNVLWLCQDLREFELYGTVEVAVCCLDTVNHLSRKSDLSKFFSLVHNYLDPDGLFIFDINGKGKFEKVYADRSYVMEEDGDVCIWQNDYNEEKQICDFYITLFKQNFNGSFDRFDDTQRERMYTIEAVRKALVRAGFCDIKFFSDFSFSEATDESERIYIVAKCKK